MATTPASLVSKEVKDEEVDLGIYYQEGSVIRDGAASPEEFSTNDAILVQVSRCYDALMLILARYSETDAAQLSLLHEQGGLMSPPISLNPDLAG